MAFDGHYRFAARNLWATAKKNGGEGQDDNM
jgi:hypothetical protein